MVHVIVDLLSATIDLLAFSLLISLNITQWLAMTVAYIAEFEFKVKAHAKLRDD